ncbi:MAG: VWA domain-containing protein [Chloroflexota bacterium]
MTFGTPALLALLVVLPLAALVYVLVQRRRPRYTARFTNLNLLANVMPRRPAWRRYLPPALYLLSLGALLTALAKPYATVKLPKQEGTVMLVMDVSGSMDARDVQPTRLSAAVTEAEHFVDKLPGRFQVGVVAFSSGAQVLTPPTTDRVQVRNALESLRANGGTAMGDGIERGLDFSRQNEQPAAPGATTHDFLKAPPRPSPSGASPVPGGQPGAGSGQGAAPGQPSSGVPSGQQPAAGSGQGQAPGQPSSAAPSGRQPGASGVQGAAPGQTPPSGPGRQQPGAGAVPGQPDQPGAAGAPAATGGASSGATPGTVGQGGGGVPGTTGPVGVGQGGSGASVLTNGHPMAMVLLSDGASNAGQVPPEIAAEDASQLHVPIYTIALGTPAGTLDVRVGSRGVRRIPVPPDPAVLQRVAQISGGRFFAAPSDRDLHSIYDNLATRIGFDTQQQDVTPLFIGAAAVLLLLGGGLATLWFHRFP